MLVKVFVKLLAVVLKREPKRSQILLGNLRLRLLQIPPDHISRRLCTRHLPRIHLTPSKIIRIGIRGQDRPLLSMPGKSHHPPHSVVALSWHL